MKSVLRHEISMCVQHYHGKVLRSHDGGCCHSLSQLLNSWPKVLITLIDSKTAAIAHILQQPEGGGANVEVPQHCMPKAKRALGSKCELLDEVQSHTLWFPIKYCISCSCWNSLWWNWAFRILFNRIPIWYYNTDGLYKHGAKTAVSADLVQPDETGWSILFQFRGVSSMCFYFTAFRSFSFLFFFFFIHLQTSFPKTANHRPASYMAFQEKVYCCPAPTIWNRRLDLLHHLMSRLAGSVDSKYFLYNWCLGREDHWLSVLSLLV